MPKGQGRDPRGSEDEREVGKIQYADRDIGEGMRLSLGDRENADWGRAAKRKGTRERRGLKGIGIDNSYLPKTSTFKNRSPHAYL